MNVLFISSWYPNSQNSLKGIFVKKHAAAIKSAGINIEVLAITVSYSKKIFEKKEYKITDENGIPTHIIELNSRFYKLIHIDLFLQFGFLKKCFYRSVRPYFKPDIIHSNVLYPAAVMSYWLSEKEKLPHVITEHWSKVDNFFRKSLYAGSGKRAYNSAKGITVVSEFLKKSLSKHLQYPDKIKVVPNVVDTLVFSFKEKPVNQKLTFCCVAHWNGVKRPDLIFKSLNKFSAQSLKPVLLNVVGEGELLNELKKGKWNFEVNYSGNLDRNALAQQLQLSDYFLHASDMETFSIVIAEALATGTPVLASNVGAIPELLNDTNGLLCENTVENWTEALKQIVQKKYNHHLISSNSDRFGLLKTGSEFKELYKKLIQI